MASTVIVCEVQAMYVANSRALCHLHAFMRVSASLGAHDLWIAVIYFWFAKTLRRLHYQLLAPMSLMNLRHLGLTDRIDSIPPLRNRELEHLVIGVELERPARHLRHKVRHLRSRMSAGDKEIPAPFQGYTERYWIDTPIDLPCVSYSKSSPHWLPSA